jgi:magnesium and cobalt transporter
MADHPASDDVGQRLWKRLRALVGIPAETSLRDQIEDAIDGADDDAPMADDLSAVERTMFRNLLQFGDRTADDVVVPRADIIAFDVAGDFAALVQLFREAGHSRVPVYRGELDDVIGMIHIKDVYNRVAEAFDGSKPGKRFNSPAIESLIRPVLFVPSSMGVLDLLARMRHAHTHMAIVIDEFGGTDGIVTIEDLVEEIVGEIEDEHDEAEEGLSSLGDDLYEADARVELTDLEAALGVDLINEAEDEEVDTVGGMVFLLAGRIPEVGEIIAHPSGWRFEVVAGDARMISRVRIHPPQPAESPDA